MTGGQKGNDGPEKGRAPVSIALSSVGYPGGHCIVPVVPKWRNVRCHSFSQKTTTHAFEWLCASIIPMRITMAKKLCWHVQRLNNYGLQSGHYRQFWAHSNPKWPVEWVANNWSIIPQSASTRGQNRPPTPPLGGGGPRSKVFRATGRLYTAMVSESPCHERCLAMKTPNPKWPVARVTI